MKKLSLVIIVILILSFISCSKKSNNYEIINEESLHNIKTSLNIRLKEKVNKNTLREIANELYSSRNNFERVFIVYYLPGMEVDKGGWATTHFNPNLEIVILGTENDLKLNNNDQTEIKGKIIGSWIDNTMGINYKLISDNKKLYMVQFFKDGSSLKENIIKKKIGGIESLIDPDDSKGYYRIETDGKLSLYDKQDGRLLSFPKL